MNIYFNPFWAAAQDGRPHKKKLLFSGRLLFFGHIVYFDTYFSNKSGQ